MKKRILFSASLFHAVNDAASVAVPMIFPVLYNQKFIITKYSHIGILANLGLLTTMVFQVLVVNRAHKMEYKQTVLISLTGIAFFLWMLTFASGFISWLLLYLALRAFMSFYHPVGIAVVSRTHPDKALDFAMGIQAGSGNLGVLVAFVTAGYMAQTFGWKAPLYGWAAVVMAAGLVSFAWVRSTNALHKDMCEPKFKTWVSTTLSIKHLIPGFVFGGACWGATVYYVPSLLHHKFQVPLGTTGVFLASWITLGAIMPYLFGYLCRKIGRSRIVLFGLSGSTLVVALLGLAWSKTAAISSLLIYGSFLFLIYPGFQSYVGNRVPARDQAVAFSIVANIQMLSGAVVNLLAGFMSDRFGINTPFLFLSALGILVTGYFFSDRRALSAEDRSSVNR